MKFFNFGTKSGFVGLKLYSKFFDANIIITKFYTDDFWFFKFEESPDGREHQAQSPLSYFIKNNMVIGGNNNE